ncbi:MAG TPA: DNA-deoxyinosine glycosylase, partial [Mycobacterium sp.]|nr:DNA-deoxyinosine glycosylase [Mycobacterium sp.]
DVLHACRRAGSSDAKFDAKSLVVNDFRRLFATRPLKQTLSIDRCDVDAPVSFRLLPSSSPARAMPAGQKLTAWRVIAPS